MVGVEADSGNVCEDCGGLFMKVYLAASFKMINELREYAKQLRKAGHEVTSSWLRERSKPDVELLPGDNYRKNALIDLFDIDRADTFAIFTVPGTEFIKRGGKHFEAGYAHAKGKTIHVIGPDENIFYQLPEMIHYESWDQYIYDHGSEV